MSLFSSKILRSSLIAWTLIPIGVGAVLNSLYRSSVTSSARPHVEEKLSPHQYQVYREILESTGEIQKFVAHSVITNFEENQQCRETMENVTWTRVSNNNPIQSHFDQLLWSWPEGIVEASGVQIHSPCDS